MKAFCWASGLIEFGPRVPRGALLIAHGKAKALRGFVEGVARHGYRTRKVAGRTTKVKGSECLIVPGVPEAELLGVDALDQLRVFLGWIRRQAPKGVQVFRP